MTLPLIDRHNRVATDLRLSVTDVCNLRCSYCLPASGISWLPRETVLSVAELVRLAHLGIDRLGITKVRLTGGEPLTRPDLAEIVSGIRQGHPQVEIALTTNGVGLAEQAAALKAAGLDRVNISLDTVDPEEFKRLTRRTGLDRVLAGIDGALLAGLEPTKINTVLLKQTTAAGIWALLDFCLARGLELRFIEHMPIGATRDWARENLMGAADVRAVIEKRHELRPIGARGTAPAARWEVIERHDGGGLGTIGIIASVTEPFCGACDRTRISSDGQLRSCLFSRTETDLRTALRAGASDDELIALWRGEMLVKPRAHGSDEGGFDEGFVQPDRPMHAIGG